MILVVIGVILVIVAAAYLVHRKRHERIRLQMKLGGTRFMNPVYDAPLNGHELHSYEEPSTALHTYEAAVRRVPSYEQPDGASVTYSTLPGQMIGEAEA